MQIKTHVTWLSSVPSLLSFVQPFCLSDPSLVSPQPVLTWPWKHFCSATNCTQGEQISQVLNSAVYIVQTDERQAESLENDQLLRARSFKRRFSFTASVVWEMHCTRQCAFRRVCVCVSKNSPQSFFGPSLCLFSVGIFYSVEIVKRFVPHDWAVTWSGRCDSSLWLHTLHIFQGNIAGPQNWFHRFLDIVWQQRDAHFPKSSWWKRKEEKLKRRGCSLADRAPLFVFVFVFCCCCFGWGWELILTKCTYFFLFFAKS